jgi:hypothetical protein
LRNPRLPRSRPPVHAQTRQPGIRL